MYSVSAPAHQAQQAPAANGQKPRNARFWVSWGQTLSKITLALGQSVTLYQFSSHEEGWTRHWMTLEHTGQSVQRINHEEGIDCDGRYSYTATSECLLPALAAIKTDFFPELVPDWILVDCATRDYTAEAAGY